MKVLDEPVDKQNVSYTSNYDAMMRQNEELDKITQSQMFIDKKYRDLAKKRDKLQTRDRVNAILDKGTPFLELS